MTHYTREQLETTLAPLCLPKAGEDRSTFEPELDARLTSLAWLADLSASECVGLALWLGSQEWKGFEIDLADCEENPASVGFVRNVVISGSEYDKQGKELPAQRAAHSAGEAMRAMGLHAPAESSLNTYVRQRRAERSKLSEEARRVRNPELLAAYMQDESKLSIEQVKRMRRDQLRRELQWSAARLQAS